MHTNELHGTKFRLIKKNCSLYDLPTGIISHYYYFAESSVRINVLFQKLLADLNLSAYMKN
jgi:hypothetical protein